MKVVLLTMLQWMVTGHNGPPGKNALVPAVRVTGPESGPAANHSMEASPVRERQWKPLSVTPHPVQVSHITPASHPMVKGK